MNKKAGFTDIFIFIIVAFVIILVSGLFIYMSVTVNTRLKESLNNTMPNVNESQVIDDTFGNVVSSFNALYWIAIFLIIGMVISIFIGSSLITTRPIFFVPYVFVVIISIIVSVGISNAYETLILTPTLASTYAGFTGSNFFMLQLPIWVTIIGFIGGIIMFSRVGSQQEVGFRG